MTEPVLYADVGVVGAGPGGMAAATRLAAAGLAVTVLDEGARAGGQIYRQLPPGAVGGQVAEPPSHDHGHHLIEGFEEAGLRRVHGATVWDAKPGRLWFEHEGQSRLLQADGTHV